MKKFGFAIMTAAMSFSLLASCEKELMSYEGEDGIYFDVRWGNEAREGYWAHQYYTPVEFGAMDIDVTTYDVRVRVTASGTPKDYDRPFSITIGADSTTAVAGEDYEAFPMDYVLKAGEQYAYIDIKMKRSEKMQKDTITLQLQLQPNEYFTCPFTNYADNPQSDPPQTGYGYNTNAEEHKIVVNDVMSRPDGWIGGYNNSGTGIMGNFSPTKWRLMMEITDTNMADYASAETMPTARANVICDKFARYLLEQAALGREHAVLDEDGTMMWVNAITTIDPANAWQPFTTLDDYYRGE